MSSSEEPDETQQRVTRYPGQRRKRRWPGYLAKAVFFIVVIVDRVYRTMKWLWSMFVE